MKEKRPNVLMISIGQILEVLFPVCLHYVIFQLTILAFGNWFDAGTLAVLAALITFPFVWVIYRKEKRPETTKKWYTLWIPLVLGIIGNFVCSGILNWIKITERFSNATQEALFQSHPMIQLVGIGIFVPVVEEWIFRGLVFGKLKQYYGKMAAVLFSALLFAVYHGNVVQMLYAFPMGIAMALIYDKWGMLAAPAAFHIGANLFGVLSSVLG